MDLVGRGVDVPGVAAPSERTVWESLSPDPNLLLRDPRGVAADAVVPTAEVARLRRTSLSSALSVSYAQPLRMVRGSGARLFDEDGRLLFHNARIRELLGYTKEELILFDTRKFWHDLD